MAALVAVLVLCAGGLSALSMQVRCVDAAREAARLAARGDGSATEAARRIAPRGALVEVRGDGAFYVARVSVDAPLPGLTLAAEAASAREPGM
ncbi:TadE family type IV pilus minor pilin [Mycolicibacterium goodii]|uniref:Pilus biosynthesis protein TadE n=1 Tax=Mycolicibacterium goodii TaxID=134601 RepID=A0ABS6HPY4_MYCGD|nr:TadE family type IV pilus minor pilin [Mycolicibacterium goodii]MBU8807966.1 pilus biosynthesis protein TadE [Mycolicibacterium goodii]MBU8824336.1 pilus biosynthesis protein TadE [Mycolicibacterium goodii]MBU8827914.1 pilus biosynthesis protein TadE [Mycolicibacterium goodii]MBU8837588.1 pilus biosynthesis protein TadE [Mycolicibacterium goodii]PJK23826.1 pilus biosynthesis protein TadE [Mycolicibacterium goodii]